MASIPKIGMTARDYTISEISELYRSWLRSSMNSSGTAETYFEAFKRFVRFMANYMTGKEPETFDDALHSLTLPIRSIRIEDFESYKGYLKGRAKSTSFIATEISALVCFLKFLKKRYYQPGIEVLIENARELRPKVTQKVPDSLEKFQIDIFLEACENITERVLVGLLFYTGARIKEILSLSEDDIIYREDQTEIKVLGKGDKERIIPLTKEAQVILEEYLVYLKEKDQFKKKYEGSDKSMRYRKLFTMSYDSAWRIIRSLGDRAKKDAGLQKSIHPHVLRHSFGCELLKRGASIRTIAELMGHADLNTTKRYTKVVHALKVQAVNLLSDSQKDKI
jgi:integrase/recombinase XerD